MDRGRPQRPGAQLRMELRGDEVRMAFQFQDFHAPPVVRPADVSQARVLQLGDVPGVDRSEEHTSELQSQSNLVCRLLLEKKKKKRVSYHMIHCIWSCIY